MEVGGVSTPSSVRLVLSTPSSHGLSAGSRNLICQLDPADKPRDDRVVDRKYFISALIPIRRTFKPRKFINLRLYINQAKRLKQATINIYA